MRRPVLWIGLVLIAALTALRLSDPAPLSVVRLAYFDWLQRMDPREPAALPVRVVDINEASLAQLGQWPWSRDRLADLTDRLAEAGAAVIAFDMIFAEPDRLSPVRFTEDPALSKFLNSSITPGDLLALDTDRSFAEAIRSAPVVLGIARSGRQDDPLATPKSGVVLVGDTPAEALPELGPTTSLVPMLAEAAQGIGALSVGPDSNGAVARTLPLLWTSGDALVPSLALEVLRVYLGEANLTLWQADGVPGTAGKVSVGPHEIPVSQNGRLWLRARPEDPRSYIPAYEVLTGTTPADLKGAVVLVGTSAAGLLDLRTTALGETVPGVAVHAQAVEQILTGEHLIRSDFAGAVELLLFVSAGLIVAASMSLSGLVTAVITGGLATVAIAGTSWAGFANGGLLLDATFPLAGTFLLFSVLALYRLFVTDREARMIRRSFSHYVAPEVLSEIERGGHEVALGGRNRPVTVMFSDIRNFTQLSEALDAEGVVTLLNRIFAALSDEIITHRGTIDKYIGDSVMAFWNAPIPVAKHAESACHAALAMRSALERANAEPGVAQVRMGLGLATGIACVGNIGSRERFNYTAVGVTVNVAARLETACRSLECDILASSTVRAAAPDFAWLPAGSLGAKGVSGRLDAYVLVGDPSLGSTPAFSELLEAHENLLQALASGRDPASDLSKTRDLARGFPGLTRFYERFPDRVGDF
ncbi:MAG: adenylate/guanylate cyclase domain-containing protein [Pseudomonadota bacterium]